MKKILNGLLYNTETATLIGATENGYDRSRFDYFYEGLYRKKTGEYFLFGEGHAKSRYGVWHGNTGNWGSKIMPMSFEDAQKWAEKNLTVDEYSAEFGEPDEAPTGKVALNLSVLPETKAKLEKMRQETGKSMSQLIDELVSK